MNPIMLRLARSDEGGEVSLRLPAAEENVDHALNTLASYAEDAGAITRIIDVISPVSGLKQYVWGADIENSQDLQKLNQLAELIGGMDDRQMRTFSGALDCTSINGLDDVLRVAGGLDRFELLDGIDSDRALGGYLVEHGYKNFPQEVWPYLDYRAIGAEYCSEHGGAYGPGGFVRHKGSMEQTTEKRASTITLHLLTKEAEKRFGGPYRLTLPASKENMDTAKVQIGVDDFTEADIVEIEFEEPHLDELIPQCGFCVEDANDLALAIEDMLQRDDEFIKYMAVLSVVRPENLTGALHLALDLDNYEQVPEDASEYGKEILRSIGADDEIIDTIDGYMDFEQLGKDSMAEYDIRQTDFGLICSLGCPFPPELDAGQRML